MGLAFFIVCVMLGFARMLGTVVEVPKDANRYCVVTYETLNLLIKDWAFATRPV